jgi:hypothetical protein
MPTLAVYPYSEQSITYFKPFGSARTYIPFEDFQDGSSRVHLSFDCTLQQLADGAFLTVADTSFALTELGLLKLHEGNEHGEVGENGRLCGIDGTQNIIFTRELIFKMAQNLRSRKKPIDRSFLCF